MPPKASFAVARLRQRGLHARGIGCTTGLSGKKRYAANPGGEVFVPAAANLLQQLHNAIPGPNLQQLLAKELDPVRVALEWLDSLVGGPVEKLLYPGSTGSARTEQEKVRKWRNGIDLPSSQSIRLFAESWTNAGRRPRLALLGC